MCVAVGLTIQQPSSNPKGHSPVQPLTLATPWPLQVYYVCQIAMGDIACFPPPAPPSPPLNPPSPPSPPAPPNCAPTYNATFFCDATAAYCYSYINSSANFAAARTSCQALGGYLVQYTSGVQQYDVEQVGCSL
jgi:hypothetical protein